MIGEFVCAVVVDVGDDPVHLWGRQLVSAGEFVLVDQSAVLGWGGGRLRGGVGVF